MNEQLSLPWPRRVGHRNGKSQTQPQKKIPESKGLAVREGVTWGSADHWLGPPMLGWVNRLWFPTPRAPSAVTASGCLASLQGSGGDLVRTLHSVLCPRERLSLLRAASSHRHLLLPCLASLTFSLFPPSWACLGTFQGKVLLSLSWSCVFDVFVFTLSTLLGESVVLLPFLT